MAMNEQDQAVRDRLRRAEGQIRGIIKMLDEGRRCDDVVTQLLAVRTAIDRATTELVANHIDDCLAQLPPTEEARETIGRVIKLLGRAG